MSLFEGIAAGAGAASSLANAYVGYKNYKLQQDQYGYEKDLQQQLFAREDNAVQRRVTDLKAAGLSPVLAAGSAASAGPVVNTSPPQMDQIPNVAQEVLTLLKMQNDISMTDAQKDLMEYQKALAASQTVGALANARNSDSQAWRNSAEAKIADYDLQRYKKTGYNPRNASQVGKIANEFSASGEKAIEGLKNGWKTYDEQMMKIQRKLEDGVKNLWKGGSKK